MAISYQDIYPRLKKVLSDDKGGKPHPSAIRYDMELKEPPLSFTGRGMRALTHPLSEEFNIDLSPQDVANATYVKDLARLIHSMA